MTSSDDFWAFEPEQGQPRPGHSDADASRKGRKRRRDEEDDTRDRHNKVSGNRSGDDGAQSSQRSHGRLDRIPWRHGRVVASELLAAESGATTTPPGFHSAPSRAPLLRLHEEILDFVAFISPTPTESRIAARAVAEVQQVIMAVYPQARIEIFGSRANGLVLPTSDWDLVVFGASSTSSSMHRLAKELEKSGVARRTEVIDSARVPIVKAWEAGSGIQVDISFEAASGLSTRACITSLLERYPPLRPLVVLLKYFMVQRGLNDTYSGGVGSFLLTLMAAHVVQTTARRLGIRIDLRLGSDDGDGAAGSSSSSSGQGQKAKKAKVKNKGKDGHKAFDIHTGALSGSSAAAASAQQQAVSPAQASGLNLGTLLVSFFELYGSTLNYMTTGISLRGGAGTGFAGGYYNKSSRGWYDPNRPQLLSLENPVDPTADVGRNSWAVQRVRRSCMYAHQALARAVRAWEAQSGSSGRGNRTRDGLLTVAPPQSILASVIRIDETLASRADELEAHRLEAGFPPISMASAAYTSLAGGGAGASGAGASGLAGTASDANNSGDGFRRALLKAGARIPEGGGLGIGAGVGASSAPSVPSPAQLTAATSVHNGAASASASASASAAHAAKRARPAHGHSAAALKGLPEDIDEDDVDVDGGGDDDDDVNDEDGGAAGGHGRAAAASQAASQQRSPSAHKEVDDSSMQDDAGQLPTSSAASAGVAVTAVAGSGADVGYNPQSGDPSQQGPQVEAARAAAMAELHATAAATGIQLRRSRLLADVLSRKERGVPRVIPAPDGGWF